MTIIPKPKHCGQNWLDMNPTEGGRICGQCEKKIVDFSKSSWSEIEKLQSLYNNGLCGMYHPKQLENWGQEIPESNNSLLKAAVITGISISIANSSYAQIITTDSLVVEGKIIDGEIGEGLPATRVRLKNSKVEAMTDLDGNFKLVLRNVPSSPIPDTLEIESVGFKNTQFAFSDMKQLEASVDNVKLDHGKLNITLDGEGEIIAFYVHAPTRAQRMKWKIKNWFRRKDK